MNKKKLLLYLSIVCYCLTVGCTQSRNELQMSYVVDDTYVTDFVNDGIYTADKQVIWDTTSIKKEELDNKNVISFDGKQISGAYMYSKSERNMSYTADYYESDTGDFQLRSDTGELTGISFKNAAFYDIEPFLDDLVNSEADALQIAEKIASQWIDPTNYEIEMIEPREYCTVKDGKEYRFITYGVLYVKKIGNIPTTDYIAINITSKGHLSSIYWGESNSFNNLNSKDVPLSEIDNSIQSKIKEIYSSMSEYTYVNYNIDEQTICYTPEKSIAIVSRIQVKLKTADNIEFTTGIELTTTLAQTNY